MSVRVMTAAWSADLPAGDKLVLLALADCANDEGHCWPGLATLCVKTGRCKRSLQESLRTLDSAGHISRKENPGKGMNYVVHPVAKDATGAIPATGAKSATGGSKDCHRGVAKSAPKPLGNRKEPLPLNRAIPADWQPDEFSVESESRKVVDGWPPGELPAQIEQFKAHHSAKGNKFTSPQQAWSTWVLNTRKFGIGRNGSQPSLRRTRPNLTDLLRAATGSADTEDRVGDRLALPAGGYG